MKTMGLSDLYLVSPKEFPSAEADRMAAGAKSMLEQVRVTDSLSDAVADCTVVIASTARPRGYDLPELNPEQAAQLLCKEAEHGPVGLLFGPERMGLHNDDMRHARYRVTIPANPDYNSLNMAAAVQTLAYELFKASGSKINDPVLTRATNLPTSAEVDMLYQHLEKVLKDISFLRPHQGETMQRLRHLISRAEPDKLELNILRGILSAVERSLNSDKLR